MQELFDIFFCLFGSHIYDSSGDDKIGLLMNI